MLIEVKDLQVDVDNKTLISNIHFSVRAGEHLCITGPNGAGKSTLLRTLNGMMPVSKGEISLQQQPLKHYSQKHIAQQISYVSQSGGHALPFIVDDFLKMARYPHQHWLGSWRAEDQTAIDRALDITECQGFKYRQMTTLSGGECQKVMIAAALAQDTPIILLDEPTNSLDPHHQTAVQSLIRTLHVDYGKTIIEVSHDINHASQHTDTVLALKDGQLLWTGPAEQFLDAKRLQDLYQQDFVFVPHPQTGRNIALTAQHS
ncbi:ABC transporter ATP-binding protein [Methylophaga sp. OBS3]|uniref:ABC transporter ATP-binding protein n=1 Tax=Methylophaga sp. OBS3 TaxID=2991934 RepID=UPI002258FC3E|nr:ABC transporter ATP-binding protein [Methylophaga sp. OBS3]MCX4190151.1 ABC transporter ATP-binding protein [Methylophaga sp. OBS3]